MSLTNMDLRTARYIVCLTEHLNFTKAARELDLTQSALSRSVQQIEQVLGFRLFDRDRGGVQLTAMGRIVVDGAKELLQHSMSFDDLLSRLQVGAQTSVKFGMARTAAAALLPQILQAEMAEEPGLQHRVAVRSYEFLLEMLLAREIEFFVSAEHGRAVSRNLQVHAIAKFPMTQLVRTGHPLLRSDTLMKYEDYPWMISSTEADTNAVDLGYFHLRASSEIMLEDLGCAAQLAETTDLIWITSSFSAIRELQEGRLLQLPFPQRVSKATRAPYTLMIYQLQGRTLSPAALRLTRRFTALAARLQQTV